MNREAMNLQVEEELKHIPKHPKDHQSELRMVYNMARRRSLGEKVESTQTAKDVLEYSIRSVRERHPAAVLSYDKSFFGG